MVRQPFPSQHTCRSLSLLCKLLLRLCFLLFLGFLFYLLANILLDLKSLYPYCYWVINQFYSGWLKICQYQELLSSFQDKVWQPFPSPYDAYTQNFNMEKLPCYTQEISGFVWHVLYMAVKEQWQLVPLTHYNGLKSECLWTAITKV
jgi:hypothetical protein